MKLRKDGKTSLGKQRWKCSFCNTRMVLKREDVERREQFYLFQDWAINKDTVDRTSEHNRMWFYRNTLWCFDLDFTIPITGEVYDILIVDATYFTNNDACIILKTPKHAVGRLWCNRESYETYYELLSKFPAPSYLVTDGDKACMKVVQNIWNITKIQRCLVHIRRAVTLKLPKNSKLEAERKLRSLSIELVNVKTRIAANRWSGRFDAWKDKYIDLVNEKTQHINKDTGRKSWRYKHTRLRLAYSHINNPYKKGDLFRFLDNENVSRTTNDIEGGINARVKELNRSHRGTTPKRRRKIIDLFLLSRSEFKVEPFIDDFVKKTPQNVT
jgi:hypothetical protein